MLKKIGLISIFVVSLVIIFLGYHFSNSSQPNLELHRSIKLEEVEKMIVYSGIIEYEPFIDSTAVDYTETMEMLIKDFNNLKNINEETLRSEEGFVSKLEIYLKNGKKIKIYPIEETNTLYVVRNDIKDGMEITYKSEGKQLNEFLIKVVENAYH